MTTTSILARCAVLTVGAAATAVLVGAATSPATAAPSPGVCTSGSILAGTYSSLVVNGVCVVDAGMVNVTSGITIKPGAALFADYAASDLHVKGNVTVGNGAVLVLGCAPTNAACSNDPSPAHPTLATHHSVGGKVTVSDGTLVRINSTNIKGDLAVVGGGNPCVTVSRAPSAGLTDVGGDLCVSAFEDNNVGGSVTIKNVSAGWIGFIRNQVVGTVTYAGNTSSSALGNEIVGNKVGGDLRCQNNLPAPQAGTAPGGPNLVAGTRTGQCAATSLP